jgi:DUF4097 and DUF4098 domain-containing protein YvlB
MGFRCLNVILIALLAASTGLARERTVERTFPSSGNPVLKIATYRGTITVESSEENVVRVKVTATTGFEQEAAATQALDCLQLDWQQAKNTLSLTATNPRETRVRFFWQEDEQLGVDIIVTVPRTCSLNLVSGNGGIKVGDITGNVSAKTGAGVVFCRHIDGGLVVRNGQGDIIVSRCTGDADLTAQRGLIRTGPIGGKATVSAVNGDIEILSVSGGLVARTDAGDITAGITRQFVGAASVRADGGNVTLKIDPLANVDLSASSVWGQVRMIPAGRLDLPLVTQSGGLGHHGLVARLNAGGTVIEAHASGGHVNLTGEVPPFS